MHEITKAEITAAKPPRQRINPIKEALKYAEVLKQPSIETYSQVGAEFGVSRARVSQMLSLLKLDQSIQKYLISIEEQKIHNYFTERKLRNIATIKDKTQQAVRFKKLVAKVI